MGNPVKNPETIAVPQGVGKTFCSSGVNAGTRQSQHCAVCRDGVHTGGGGHF